MATGVDHRLAESLDARLTALFRAHVDAVFNVAYRVVWNRNDAEDVVQASFIKVFTRLDQLVDQTRDRPWLLQIAYRESIAVIRKRRDVPMDPTDVPEQVTLEPGPEHLAVASAIAVEVPRALRAMDPDERIAVVLRDVEQLPMREVARVLDVGLSAAKMRVHRGRQSLRHLLQDSEVL